MALAAFAACDNKVDPENGGDNGGGNGDKTEKSNERSIISIKFEGQIGEAVIESQDADAGSITFQLASNLVKDMAAVKIEDMVISYKATSSVEVGGTIDFTGAAQSITITSESGKTRTYSLDMEQFDESFAGCYSVTGSVVVGGLGGSEGWGWGTMMLAAPEEKSWCWDADGYGPEANYDDYFEITLESINDDGSTEGTCRLYGGVDGKHWNCVFDGSCNKAVEGQDIDLRNFYRVIPLGESHWKRDYAAGTITFTSKDGVETVAAIKDGTISFSADKSFTIPDQALAFQLKGDQTWNEAYIYTDYQKFAISPIYYALLVSKVAEIPAESRTEGSEGEINIVPVDPDEPGPDDPGTQDTGLDGTYIVSSLKVLGGVGSTAFVEVKDKSWEWNSSVNCEYDNTLTVTLDASSTATTASGKINWQAGEDGKFWDYVLVAAVNKLGTGDIDLSYNYDRLPHSETAFSLDVASGEAVIGESNVRIYTSGTYTITEEYGTTGSITIPNGGLGLSFGMQWLPDSEYTWDAAWAYTDFERFYLHPYKYVMIFTKQDE